MSGLWRRVATAQAGERYAEAYARRFRELEAAGKDVHGEARFVDEFCGSRSRILDAGCGTGRIGARLAALGHDVVGCDADETMVRVARRDWPEVRWEVVDLAVREPGSLGDPFDLVLLAGNVLPLLDPGTLVAVLGGLRRAVRPGGSVVAGFGLDAAHLPAGCEPTPLETIETAALSLGFRIEHRWAGWDGAPFLDGGYVVTAWSVAGPRQLHQV